MDQTEVSGHQRGLEIQMSALGGMATGSEGFVTCFLKVPLACLGSEAGEVGLKDFLEVAQAGRGWSSAAALQPGIIIICNSNS